MRKFIVVLVVLVGDPRVCLVKSFHDEDEAEELRNLLLEWASNFIDNKVLISSIPLKNNERVLDFVVKYIRDNNKFFVKVLEIEK